MKAKTLAIVKPDGVRRNLTGECIRRLQKKNLKLIDIRICQLTQTKAKQLYKDIKKKHPRIYLPLIEYMTSGQIVILILEGKKAAAKARKIAGPTNPKDAPKGTIRGDFAKGDMKKLYQQGKVTQNIIHTSENEEEAKEEIRILLKEEKIELKGGERK
ncbi:nucleoside-diphosphate kinase [archaeon]|jgi:nucleoside-diphosphate kinase|nr:nucleoside-diphosphate kinase [archaeon]MBT4373269.1 nucleoside-diphosphate kinase [archaeon]MBT4531614.1 nucleoside-diphosphate kinase [archaeon]MBT7001208.1 nucleoside-diphosphate kinase [archaeon]MBT7282306.1 nucleoside-diphosphate kinase [archaeon]